MRAAIGGDQQIGQGPGGGELPARCGEDDRSDLEQDPLESGREVGVGADRQPQGGGAVLEVVPRRGAVTVVARAHVPRAGALRPDQAVRPRGAERGDRHAVVRRVGQCGPDRAVRVVGRETSCLPEHLRRRMLPVGAGAGVLRRGESKRAGLGLQLLGLVEPTRHLVAHVVEVRSARTPTATRCEVFDPHPQRLLAWFVHRFAWRGVEPTRHSRRIRVMDLGRCALRRAVALVPSLVVMLFLTAGCTASPSGSQAVRATPTGPDPSR